MDTEIYYFSGTGNSLYIAKALAQRLGGRPVPIAALRDNKAVRIGADIAGIVFPVYYGELPPMVRAFAEKLTDACGKYIFAVCNYGGAASFSLKLLQGILQSRGGELSVGYGVHMPQNAFYKPWENHSVIYRRCQRRLDLIVDNTQSRKKGMFYSNLPLEWFIRRLHTAFKPLYIKKFIQLSGGTEEMGLDELVFRTDRSYRANDACTGCGICAAVCPAGNIRIEEGRPVWLHRCETCLACYNWCPRHAIEGGVSAPGYHYIHPDIRVSEMTVK